MTRRTWRMLMSDLTSAGIGIAAGMAVGGLYAPPPRMEVAEREEGERAPAPSVVLADDDIAVLGAGDDGRQPLPCSTAEAEVTHPHSPGMLCPTGEVLIMIKPGKVREIKRAQGIKDDVRVRVYGGG